MKIQEKFELTMKNSVKEISPNLFRNKEFYAQWLAQTYYFVCHSTALIGYALPFMSRGEMRSRFEEHMAEEKSHELLALKDLNRLGYEIKDFPEDSMTQAFYQSQYYRITFEGPTTLLGYILYLEGLAVHVGGTVYNEIKDLHKNSVLFLKVHAEEDPHHLTEALQNILKLPAAEQEKILNNLNFSRDVYNQMILNASEKAKMKKAA